MIRRLKWVLEKEEFEEDTIKTLTAEIINFKNIDNSNLSLDYIIEIWDDHCSLYFAFSDDCEMHKIGHYSKFEDAAISADNHYQRIVDSFTK